MCLREFRARRVFEAADRIVHLDSPSLPHHLKTIDVRVFVVAIHAGDKRSDRPVVKLQAKRCGRILPRASRIAGMPDDAAERPTQGEQHIETVRLHVEKMRQRQGLPLRVVSSGKTPLEQQRTADFTFGDMLLRQLKRGGIAVIVIDAAVDPLPARQRHQFASFVDIQCQWLFQKAVDLRFDRLFIRGIVLIVRSNDAEQIQIFLLIISPRSR